MLDAVAKANASMSGVDVRLPGYARVYQAALNQLKADVGTEWHEVLMDLKKCDVLPNPRNRYESSGSGPVTPPEIA